MTRLYFSKKDKSMNISIAYSYDGYHLLEILLMKFDDMNNIGMRIKTLEFDGSIKNSRYITLEFVNILIKKLQIYYKRTNKDSVRFDFNMKDLPDIINNLNINEIIEELKFKKLTSKFNI